MEYYELVGLMNKLKRRSKIQWLMEIVRNLIEDLLNSFYTFLYFVGDKAERLKWRISDSRYHYHSLFINIYIEYSVA